MAITPKRSVVDACHSTPNGWQRASAAINIDNDPSTAPYWDGTGTISPGLKGTGYGFSVPTTATITGVQLSYSCAIQGLGTAKTYSVQLLYNSATIGNAYLPAESNWAQYTTWATKTWGADGNLFGAALTPTIVNNASFGFQLQVSTDGSTTPMAEAFQMTVYYVPAKTTVWSVSLFGF